MIVIAENHETFVDPATAAPIAAPGPKDTIVLSPLFADAVVATLPDVPDDEANQLLQYQLDRHFPNGGKGIEYDHLALEKAGDTRAVALVAVNAERLAALRERVNGARITVPLGLFVAGRGKKRREIGNGELALIIGPSWLTCFGRRDGEFFLRSLPRTDSLTGDISKGVNGVYRQGEHDGELSVSASILSSDGETSVLESIENALPNHNARAVDSAGLDSKSFKALFSRNRKSGADIWRRSRYLRLAFLATAIIAGLAVSQFREIAQRRRYLDELRREVAAAQALSLDTLARNQEAQRLQEAVGALEERTPIDVYQLIGAFLVGLGDEALIDGLSIAGSRVEVTARSTDPFGVAQSLQASEFFVNVSLSQVTALAGGSYQFSITGELRNAE